MLNVKDSPYNAAGDGQTDDTEAIQAAIDDAKDSGRNGVYAGDDENSAVEAGEIVLLPKGTYLTTAPLKLLPTVTLQGEATGTLIRSVFEAPGPYDRWNGAIEMSPDDNGSLLQAGVRDLSIFTNVHCGITYDQTKKVWPAKVFTYQHSAFTDWTELNNSSFFRLGVFTLLTGSGDYLYVGFTNKSDFIPNKGMHGAGGLFWTRMKQLGFKDKWGSRLDLVWEYSASAPFGPVSTWQQFSPTAELGGGFWHYGHNGTYTPDFSDGWVAGTVHNSGSLYWIRISTTSTVYQPPIAHHVYPGVQAVINMNRFENLFFNCNNWAIFFGLFCYCQNSVFRAIRTVRSGGGCIWVVGNSNYISDCDTEGGTRDNETIGAITEPGQFTMEGDGNTIRDVIAEGGAAGQYPWYCFRGSNVTGYNLWVESRGIDTILRDRVDCLVQEVNGGFFDNLVGRMRLENSRNITVAHAAVLPDQPLSEAITLVGDSNLTLDNLWGYGDPGDMDNPRIRWNQFHSFKNRGVPLLSNITNPVTGNLVANGDFQNGDHGWELATQQGTSTGGEHGTFIDAPDGRGKELVIDITGDASGLGVLLDTTVSIPAAYAGHDAFYGFRADVEGNCFYKREVVDDGVLDDNYYSSLLNSQSAFRIRRIGFSGGTQTNSHTLRWRVVTRQGGFDSIFKYDDTTFTSVNPNFPSPVAVLEATGDQLYFGADLPVNSFSVTLQSPSQIGWIIEYWDGSAWTEVGEEEDGTWRFTESGTISFSTPRSESSRWRKRTINGAGPFYWFRFTATGQILNAPVISSITRNRTGKFYLSNVYCVIGQVHNQVPALQAQRRWVDGRVELTGSTTPPTTGNWKVGDVIWNSTPSAGGAIGIVCTTAGNGSSLPSPNATWKTFGTIAS